MKRYQKMLLVMVLLVVMKVNGYAQSEVINNFASSLQKGDTKELMKNLGENVEMNMEGNRQTVNKVKSEAIIKDFLSRHPLSKFEYIHKGSSGTAAYAIGKYTSNDGNFRVVVKTDGQMIEKIDFTKE